MPEQRQLEQLVVLYNLLLYATQGAPAALPLITGVFDLMTLAGPYPLTLLNASKHLLRSCIGLSHVPDVTAMYRCALTSAITSGHTKRCMRMWRRRHGGAAASRGCSTSPLRFPECAHNFWPAA